MQRPSIGARFMAGLMAAFGIQPLETAAPESYVPRPRRRWYGKGGWSARVRHGEHGADDASRAHQLGRHRDGSAINRAVAKRERRAAAWASFVAHRSSRRHAQTMPSAAPPREVRS